jgi:hypothetical protein
MTPTINGPTITAFAGGQGVASHIGDFGIITAQAFPAGDFVTRRDLQQEWQISLKACPGNCNFELAHRIVLKILEEIPT